MIHSQETGSPQVECQNCCECFISHARFLHNISCDSATDAPQHHMLQFLQCSFLFHRCLQFTLLLYSRISQQFASTAALHLSGLRSSTIRSSLLTIFTQNRHNKLILITFHRNTCVCSKIQLRNP
jgi:hypothetical protein